jgi:hypothetical protein
MISSFPPSSPHLTSLFLEHEEDTLKMLQMFGRLISTEHVFEKWIFPTINKRTDYDFII